MKLKKMVHCYATGKMEEYEFPDFATMTPYEMCEWASNAPEETKVATAEWRKAAKNGYSMAANDANLLLKLCDGDTAMLKKECERFKAKTYRPEQLSERAYQHWYVTLISDTAKENR